MFTVIPLDPHVGGRRNGLRLLGPARSWDSSRLGRAIEFLHPLFLAKLVIRKAVLSSVVVHRGSSDGDKAYRRSWGPLTVRYDDDDGEPIILIRESVRPGRWPGQRLKGANRTLSLAKRTGVTSTP